MTDGAMSEQRRPRIVVIGSINLDLVYHVPRLPQPGETLTGTSFQQIHGGKGANQAVAAARLNAEVSMVGRIGDDAFGMTLIAGLRHEAVDVVVCDESDNPRHIPSFAVTAVDTTAAGDAFAGALGFCLAKGLPILEALRFASAAGALASTRQGGQPAMPRLGEVMALGQPT